jgi:carbonic anhydrase
MLLDKAIEQNVLVQLDHLRTHPAVAEAIECGTLRLHGWVYRFETGEVLSFRKEQDQFLAFAGESDLGATA